MNKILVTTDFSTASKAGLRFAIQLATQMEAELVFFHCFQALIPTNVLQERIEIALQQQGAAQLQKLERLVAQIHRAMKVTPGKHHCVVVENLNPEEAIMDYAKDHGIQLICMSTRGAGTLRKIIGTHTSHVLQHTTLPVLVVPHNYRTRPVKKILYASDLSNLEKEMPIVASFADRVQVKTDLAHFYFTGEITLDPAILKQMWQLKYPALDQIYLEPYRLDVGFPAQLDQLANKTKPTMVVFFTNTNKSWFDKLFSVSISEAVSFATKVPMLVYRKEK